MRKSLTIGDPPPKGLLRPLTEARQHDLPNESKRYVEMAKQAGWGGGNAVVSAAERSIVISTALRQFLVDNSICIYDEASVVPYMNKIVPKFHRWFWAPLESYLMPIPEPVLITAARIREAIPEARFLVTTIAALPQGDPFLAVWSGIPDVGSGVSILPKPSFIVERWDEPSFRM